MNLRRFWLLLLVAASAACRQPLVTQGSQPTAIQTSAAVISPAQTPTSGSDVPGLTETNSSSEMPAVSIVPFLNAGGRVDWSPDGTLIAYDAPDPQGYTQTFLVSPDGLHTTCLTCGNPAAPTPLHIGNPAWHPTMKWLVVQGVPQAYFDSFPLGDVADKQRLTDVGVGIGNELWVVSANGQIFTKLTDVWSESGMQGGVLHPHFSHDGRKLAWSQRVGSDPSSNLGEWVIKTADFVTTAEAPYLTNVQTFQPGGGPQRFYETHSFSIDDQRLLFSSNSGDQNPYGFDIYSLDLASGEAVNLTNSPQAWDEHAHFSPDGVWIAWVSSENAGAQAGRLRTEIWLMRSDGTEKRQLTFVNAPESAMFTPTPFGLVLADLSWAPDGRRLMVETIQNQGKQSTYSMPAGLALLTLVVK